MQNVAGKFRIWFPSVSDPSKSRKSDSWRSFPVPTLKCRKLYYVYYGVGNVRPLTFSAFWFQFSMELRVK
jgi:hypothetical protein